MAPAVRKVLTIELLDLVKRLVESLFTSAVSVHPGVLLLLFSVGLMLGGLFGH